PDAVDFEETPFFDLPPKQDRIVRDFFELYHVQNAGGTIHDTYWLGVPVVKSPLDMWIYQEILSAERPDVIVETGTAYGGSAYFMATICDLVGTGRIVTVDIEARDDRPLHPRIT